MLHIDEGEVRAVITYLKANGTMLLVEPVVKKMEEWLEQESKPKVELRDVAEQ